MNKHINMSAEGLFDRPPPKGYRDELTDAWQERDETKEHGVLSGFLVFKLHGEWLGISTNVIKEILPVKSVHSIPHRSNNILRGTVNIDGQLKLVVAIESLLEISQGVENDFRKLDQSSGMLILNQGADEWVIESPEILGIRRFNLDEMENVPVTVSKSTANYLKGIFYYDQKHIGLLEEELLFFSLKRALS